MSSSSNVVISRPSGTMVGMVGVCLPLFLPSSSSKPGYRVLSSHGGKLHMTNIAYAIGGPVPSIDSCPCSLDLSSELAVSRFLFARFVPPEVERDSSLSIRAFYSLVSSNFWSYIIAVVTVTAPASSGSLPQLSIAVVLPPPHANSRGYAD